MGWYDRSGACRVGKELPTASRKFGGDGTHARRVHGSVFFEAENSCEKIDLFRSEVLEEYKEFVENTKEERAQWQREVPDALKPLNERLNGPLLERIAADVGSKDKTFVSRMKFGFDLIGDMESCCYNEVPVERPKSFVSDLQMSLQELRDNRKELNEMVVSKVKET